MSVTVSDSATIRVPQLTPAISVGDRIDRWLRTRFASQVVIIPFFLATGAAAILTARPHLFGRVLSLDVACLAQAHVFATFCRIATMNISASQRRVLAIDSLFAVVAMSILIGSFFSLRVLITLYLFWQVFHYTRQSYGISRILGRGVGRIPGASASVLLYASAAAAFVWGLSRLQSTRFLGLSIYVMPAAVMRFLAIVLAVVSLVAMCVYLRNERKGPLLTHWFLVLHVLIFGLAYAAMPSLDVAWLVGNVWHNSQYLLIVRNAVAREGSSETNRLTLSKVAAAVGGLGFFAMCAIGGGVAYFALGQFMQNALYAQSFIPLAVYLGVNFHHYLIDGMVWKRRSKFMTAITEHRKIKVA